MEDGTATIAVIEDNQSTRRALVRQINSAGFRIVDFASALDFLNAPERFTVDCVVADMHLPMMDGLQLQEELRRTVPYAPIVFITGHPELAIGMTAMRRGATDFLEKPVDDETLFEAIGRAVDISRERRRTQAERAELEKKYDSLTPREREVFALITRGLLNKQVAAELGAAERTIKAHRARVMEKMGAESLADLVRSASLLGIGAASPSAPASEGGALRR
jgi:FixJ family two-component response regulator